MRAVKTNWFTPSRSTSGSTVRLLGLAGLFAFHTLHHRGRTGVGLLLLNREVPVEDLGMLYAFAAPEASVKNQALSQILARHLRVRAFETLRTEEQLGYAAGGGALDLYKHPMVILYIQTTQFVQICQKLH